MSVDVRTAAMTERALQQHVVRLCKDLRLRHYHPWRSDRSTPGWPDSVIVGPSGILFRELKSESGRLTAEQTGWLDALVRVGADARVWRPSDLYTGAIVRELRRLVL